jgi:hypothetical protein
MLPGWFGSLTAPGSQGIHLASLGPAPGPGAPSLGELSYAFGPNEDDRERNNCG